MKKMNVAKKAATVVLGSSLVLSSVPTIAIAAPLTATQKQQLADAQEAQDAINKELADLAASLGDDANVKTDGTVTVSSIEEAQAKLEEIKAQIADIIAKNEQLKAEYDAQVKAVEDENDRIQKEYDEALAKYEQYLKDLEAVKKNNEEVQKALDDAKNNNLGSENGMYVIGKFNTDKTGSDFYKDIKVIASQNDIVSAKTLGWQDKTIVSNPNGATLEQVTVNGVLKYRLTGLDAGDTFKLNNIGTTSDGRNINAIATITQLEEYPADGKFIQFSNEHGAIKVEYNNIYKLGIEFKFVDDNNNEMKLVVASVVSDIDTVQAGKVEFSGNTLNYINPPNSGNTVRPDGFIQYTKNPNVNLDGVNSAPDGSVLAAGYSTAMTYTQWNDVNGITTNTSGGAYALFGPAANVDTMVFLDDPDPVEKPVLKLKDLPAEPEYLPYEIPTLKIKLGGNLPQTGDMFNMPMIAGAAVSGIALASTGVVARKRSGRKE